MGNNDQLDYLVIYLVSLLKSDITIKDFFPLIVSYNIQSSLTYVLECCHGNRIFYV